jgi:hypothetical protein
MGFFGPNPLTTDQLREFVIDTVSGAMTHIDKYQCSFTNTGSGASNTNQGFNLVTGATASSTVLCRVYGPSEYEARSPLTDDNKIDWSRKNYLTGFFAMTERTTNGIGRIQLGRLHSSTTVGDLSSRSVELRAEDTSLKLRVHNGTSATTSSTLYTIDGSTNYFKIFSDGTGTVYLYINGVFVGSTSGGPTTVGSTNENATGLSVQNNADAANVRMRAGNIKVWTL